MSPVSRIASGHQTDWSKDNGEKRVKDFKTKIKEILEIILKGKKYGLVEWQEDESIILFATGKS